MLCVFANLLLKSRGHAEIELVDENGDTFSRKKTNNDRVVHVYLNSGRKSVNFSRVRNANFFPVTSFRLSC